MERIENTAWSMGELHEYWLVVTDTDTKLLLTKTEVDLAIDRAKKMENILPDQEVVSRPFWKFWNHEDG